MNIHNNEGFLAINKCRSEIIGEGKLGYEFSQQKVIKGFLMDFYCERLLLAIEIEPESRRQGPFHSYKYVMFKHFGIEVLRYKSDDILEKTEYVRDKVQKKIRERSNIKVPKIFDLSERSRYFG